MSPPSNPSADRATAAAAGQALARDEARGSLMLPGYGRIALLSCDLVRDLHFAILETYADTAQDVLYRTGFEWALQTMLAVGARPSEPRKGADESATADTGAQIGAWWSAFRAAGWGALRRTGAVGLGRFHLELQHSAVAESLGHADDPVCHLYAGLFAGAFSFLERTERHAVEIQCRSTGAESCRFVIGLAAEIDRAEALRQQGMTADAIVSRLGDTGAFSVTGEGPDGRAPASGTAAAMLADSHGKRVVGAAAEMLRSLRYVLERERAGSWSTVLKATGRASGRQLAAGRDAEFARRGQPALSAQPLPVALQPIESCLAENGWGRLTIDAAGAAEHGLIVGQLDHSCFAELLDETANLADPLPAGMLQGYFEHVTGQTLAAEEITCAQRSPGPCMFAVTTPERLALVAPYIGRESASQILARLRE